MNLCILPTDCIYFFQYLRHYRKHRYGAIIVGSYLVPNLYIGVTLTVFRSAGKIPCSKQRFIQSANSPGIWCLKQLINFMLSIPELVFVFKLLITFKISLRVVKFIKDDPKLTLFMLDSRNHYIPFPVLLVV